MKLRKQAIREALPIILGVLILSIAMGEVNQWKRTQALESAVKTMMEMKK